MSAHNEALRALFALPPVQVSLGTALVVPELPPRQAVTGDAEVDAVLWLQQVVHTGQPELIEKALEAAKHVTTPMKVLAERYGRYLVQKHSGNTMAAVFGSIGFGDLQDQARHAVERCEREREALARFGSVEAVWSDTAAEAACAKALKGLRCNSKTLHMYEEKAAAKRLSARPELVPSTLSDCLHAMEYGNALWRMRIPFGGADAHPALHAHESYCFARMAVIPPQSKGEALAVLRYMDDEDRFDRSGSMDVIRNLVATGWA